MTAASRPLLRPATDADGPAVGRVIAGCFAEYEGCLFLAEEFPELARPASHYAALGGRLWVTEDPGIGVVGSLAVFPTSDPRMHEIVKVYLAAPARGRGIAARMLETGVASARAAGAAAIRLWTDTRFADAHRFYARHGFRRLPAIRFIGDASRSWEFQYLKPLDGDGR
jgi:putative acetyltransferase